MTPNTTGKEKPMYFCEKCLKYIYDGDIDECLQPTPHSTNKWEAEFDEKFDNLVNVKSWAYEECQCGKEPCVCSKQVKDFISQTHSTLLTELEKDVEGLKKKIPFEMKSYADIEAHPKEAEIYDHDVGFNNCLSQVLELINNLKKRE